MLPPDVATSSTGEIQAIPAGESVQIPVDFDLGGSSRSVRIELKNDRGVFAIPFQPEVYELIQPATAMTRSEFDSHEGTPLNGILRTVALCLVSPIVPRAARLGGFNTSTATFQLSDPDQQLDQLPSRIMETVHVTRIGDGCTCSFITTHIFHR